MKYAKNDLQVSQRLFNILEQSKLKIESMVDSLPDVFCVIDREHNILRGNRELALMLGVPHETLIKHKLTELFTPEHWEVFLEGVRVGKDFELGIDRGDEERIIVWSVDRFSSFDPNDVDLSTVIGRDISISVTLERKNKLLAYQKGRLEAVINSTDFGLFTFDQNLLIQGEISTRANELLGAELEGKSVATVLDQNPDELKNFVQAMFQPGMWNRIKSFRKRECPIGDRIVGVEFMPVAESGVVTRVLCIVMDITKVKALETKEKRRREANASVAKILRAKMVFLDVLKSVQSLESQLDDLQKLKLAVHTLKGELGLFECHSMADLCHEWEGTWKGDHPSQKNLEYCKKLKSEMEAFITEYGTILNLDANESVSLSSGSIQSFIAKMKEEKFAPEVNRAMIELMSSSLKNYLSWMNDLWVKLAREMGKEVNPIEWKDSVPLFIEPYKPLLRSLIHAIRNSVDHGIETPKEREAAGKQRKATLIISLTRQENRYCLTLQDDGRGVDLSKVKEVSKSRKIPVPEKDEEVLDLIFSPEFSTLSRVRELSGRGVGLSTVRYEARQLGGDARALNMPGKGFQLLIDFKAFQLGNE